MELRHCNHPSVRAVALLTCLKAVKSFPLLTVEENLKTGFASLDRNERNVPDDVFSLFPVGTIALDGDIARCLAEAAVANRGIAIASVLNVSGRR